MRKAVCFGMAILLVMVLWDAVWCLARPKCCNNRDFGDENSHSSQKASAAQAQEPLALGFEISKDADGAIWAHYYLHNRGAHGLLICERMKLTITVSLPSVTQEFLLDSGHSSSPIQFVLLDAPPPQTGIFGCTNLSRRIRIDPDHVKQLMAVKKMTAELASASLIGQMEGSLLTWKNENGEFSMIPFRVSSQAESLKKYLDLFAEGDKQ